jgi:uncharacterized membrane protein YjjB (DUF3815 family)
MMIWSIPAAAIISAAFGILFNVPGKKLIWCAINGALGFATLSILTYYGVSGYISIFFASAIMAIFAEVTARIQKIPTPLFLVAALIPIVPGGRIFQFVLYLLQGARDDATSMGISALIETGGIAIGVIFISSLIKLTPKIKH